MRLPSLNALKAFEAAARHGGFIGASEELNVSRGAISRHVKLLEEDLGVPLFIRQAQGVRLTDAGRRLQAVVKDAFDMIRHETNRITQDSSDLRIICPPATSIRWLLPHLDGFRQAHPDIEVRLTTDFHGRLGFDPSEFDIGFSVAHWPGRSPDLESMALYPAWLTPACAPSYLDRAGPLTAPEDLAEVNLLHETSRRKDWTAWIDAFGQPPLTAEQGDDFPNLDMAVKAAVMGRGMVMGDLVLCRDELASGALVAPFPDLKCQSPLGETVLIGIRDKWHSPKVQAFKDWAKEVAAADIKTLGL